MLGGGDSAPGTLGPVCDLVSRERRPPLPHASSFCKFSGVCCTCLVRAGLASSFIQQIFTELLNPRSCPLCPCPSQSLSFPHLKGEEVNSSLPFSCH